MTIFNLQLNSEKVKKIFITITLSLIILEVGYLAYLFSPFSKAKTQPTSTPPPPPALFFTPGKITAKKGEEFTLNVNLATSERKIKALDVVIKYDPTILELIKVPSTGDSLDRSGSNIFDVYPENKIDKTSGIITLSGLKNKGGSFNGTSSLGTVKFRILNALPKESKETAVWFLYRQGASDESNLIDAASGQDILGEVKHATITIQ